MYTVLPEYWLVELKLKLICRDPLVKYKLTGKNRAPAWLGVLDNRLPLLPRRCTEAYTVLLQSTEPFRFSEKFKQKKAGSILLSRFQQYHRRKRAWLPCSVWERVLPLHYGHRHYYPNMFTFRHVHAGRSVRKKLKRKDNMVKPHGLLVLLGWMPRGTYTCSLSTGYSLRILQRVQDPWDVSSWGGLPA